MLLESTLKEMISESYEYITKKGVRVLFQRLIKDSKWYAVSDNQIVNWATYRNDLQEWCDTALVKSNNKAYFVSLRKDTTNPHSRKLFLKKEAALEYWQKMGKDEYTYWEELINE